MRFLFIFAFTVTLLLLAPAASHSAPAADPAEEPANVLPDLKLLDRIGEVGNRVEASASQLVTDALGFLGVPYRRGGNSAYTGFDCSGLVRTLYEQTAGLLLPRKASDQAAATEKIDKKELQPGDLVFFNTMRRAFSHVGIYIGNGKFVHAPKPGAEVRVDDLGSSYWAKHFDGARRVQTDTDNTPPK